jgi:hypothetical protein
MDVLQIALVFLIILLSIFLSVLGFQVFLILRDLRKDLNKLDRLVRGEVSESREVEQASVVDGEMVIRSQSKNTSKTMAPPSSKPRFYKKILK